VCTIRISSIIGLIIVLSIHVAFSNNLVISHNDQTVLTITQSGTVTGSVVQSSSVTPVSQGLVIQHEDTALLAATSTDQIAVAGNYISSSGASIIGGYFYIL